MVKDRSPGPDQDQPADAERPEPGAPEIVLTLGAATKQWNEPDFSGVLRDASPLVAIQSYAAAATLLERAFDAAASGAQEFGPKTCELLFQLGICRYELRQWDAARTSFQRGLDIARKIDRKPLIGMFLHELSLISGECGDQGAAIRLARDSLVVKLQHLIETSAQAGRFSKPKRRDEPLQSLGRLAYLLLMAQQWSQAETLYVFARESYEARNDLPMLCKTLIGHALAAAGLQRRDQVEHSLGRAVWSGRMAGLDLDTELARHPLPIAPETYSQAPLRSNTSGREELEQSLIAQFRAIALGLVADRLMRDHDLPERTWWHQFCSQRRPPPPFLENPDDPEFRTFQDDITAAVASRRIARIKPTDLMARTVQIHGADISFWQEGAINRHLAEIGSSLRLFIVGSDVARAAHLLSTLNRPVSEPIVPSHFILGEVRPMTALGKANFFDFTREYAISPYLNPDSAGMHDNGRICMRQVLTGHAAEFQETQDATEPLRKLTDPDIKARGVTREEYISSGLLGHEFGELWQMFPPGMPALFTSWNAIVRDDICRFTQTPRTIDEIWRTFRRAFEGLGGSYEMFSLAFPPGESPTEQAFQKTIADLLNDGLLQACPDNRYQFSGFVGD